MTRVRRSAGTSWGCYEHLMREDKISACRKEILCRRPDGVERPCMFMYCMAGNGGKSSGERSGCRRLLKKNIYTENDSESGEAITRNAIHVEKSTGTKPLRQEAGNFRGRVPS